MKRRLQAVLEIGEGAGHITRPNVERADNAADRAHSFQQAIKGPEEPEKHQHADQVTRSFASFVQPRRDAVQQCLQRTCREADAPSLLRSEHAGHRGKQLGRPAPYHRLDISLIVSEALDPRHLRIEQNHLPKDVNDAGDQDAEDHAVYRRVSHKGVDQRSPECRSQGGHKREEQPHPNEKTA